MTEARQHASRLYQVTQGKRCVGRAWIRRHEYPAITNALLLGQEAPDYNTHVIAVSVIYRFE